MLENIFPTDLGTGVSGSTEFNIWLAQLSGLPFIGLKKESAKLKLLLLLYSIPITILVTFLYMFFEIYDLVLSWPNLSDITQNSCLSFTHLAGAFKILNTFYRLQDISRIIEKFKFMTRTYVLSTKQREAYLRDDWQNKVFLVSYASLVSFTGILGFILLNKAPNIITGNFPYCVYLPNWLPHRVRLLYMGFSVLLFALQIVSVDYLNITMINHIRFHLNAIKLRFEELILNSDDCSEQLGNCTGNIENPNDVLRTIIEHHCHLKSLCLDLEDVFSLPLLIQFGTSLSIFAMAGFLATVPQGYKNIEILIQLYCGCIFVELFLYCWFGNEVFEQNKTLAITGYSSSWYRFDNRFKSSLLIFLNNAQQPIVFTAGGFIALFLPTFAGILSKAYTYIAVLRQIYGQST